MKHEMTDHVHRHSGSHKANGQPVTSNGSSHYEMEPFDTYREKIEQLLDSIGFGEFSIEPLQHDRDFNNCVYALTSLTDVTAHFILRVALDDETMAGDVALMGYLKDKLPVPHIKAYSITTDNVLGAAYTIQSRISGESLNKVWPLMEHTDKYAIVDELCVLLRAVESVRFTCAGTTTTSEAFPLRSNDVSVTEDPLIWAFEPYSSKSMSGPCMNDFLRGDDIKLLLSRHLESWIPEEIDRGQHELPCSIGPRFEKLLAMLQEMSNENFFSKKPSPIVLHHWDLEPRNLMVSNASGAWKITGIIDWDGAHALPLPLARVPPRWIWNFQYEYPSLEDGYLNDDQYPDPCLSDKDKALKSYFDAKIEKLLPGYTEDAYGRGRWMRRIWHFAKLGAFRTWEWEFLDQLPEEWAARPKGRTFNKPVLKVRAAPVENLTLEARAAPMGACKGSILRTLIFCCLIVGISALSIMAA